MLCNPPMPPCTWTCIYKMYGIRERVKGNQSPRPHTPKRLLYIVHCILLYSGTFEYYMQTELKKIIFSNTLPCNSNNYNLQLFLV